MDKFLGIISDTHITDNGRLHPAIYKLFKGADAIIHAGDITDEHILKELELISLVWAVHGNMDAAPLKATLPGKKVVEWEGKRIGIVHRSKTIERGNPKDILPLFSTDQIDCMVFGHSHKPFNRIINGILCFNPGSPSGQYGSAPSVGYLFLKDDYLSGHITSLA